MSKLDELRSQREGKLAEFNAIATKDDPSDDEMRKVEQLATEMEEIGKQIDKYNADKKKLADLKSKSEEQTARMKEIVRTTPFPTKVEDKGVETDSIEAGQSEFEKKWPTGGFKTGGEFIYSMVKAGPSLRGEDSAVEKVKAWDDLCRKAPTGMFEDSDPDGGLLVPTQFSTDIYRRMVAMNNLLEQLNPVTVRGKTMKFLALAENSRVTGSRWGGVRGFWVKEGFQYTGSKPQFRNVRLELNKLTVEVVATEELLEDSEIALESWLNNVVPDEFNFQLNDAIINGAGAGMPRGILASGSKITAAAVSGQGPNTLIFQNVLDMYSRVTAGQRRSLIWLYNQDVESSLFRMFLPTGTAAGVALFTPNEAGGGFKLMGRPALVMEQSSSLGTEGDLIAFATDGYACIKKGATQNDVSMHLRFDFDERVFKWRYRFDGEPFDNTPLTPFKGTNTTSSVVTLSSTRT
jgi:HK97 family phage major capsid protein